MMDPKEQELRAALSRLDILRAADTKFRDHLKSVSGSAKDFGLLTIGPNGMSATSLGVQVKIAAKPVVVEGEPVAFEYVFGEELQGNLIPYWRLYLDANGNLFADVERQKRLWGFDNRFVVTYILIELGLALLRSARFKPTP